MSPVDHDDAPLPLPQLGQRTDVPQLAPQPWSSRLFGALGTYLPVLLMALLAVVTWWLVKQSPEPEEPASVRPLSHEADYEMRGFSVRRQSAAGESAGVIEGERVRHYPDTDTLEIDAVRLRWRDADGRITLATASRAVAKADGSELTLEGNARVERQALGTDRPEDQRFEFRSEWLQVDTRAQRIRTDRPVVLTLGGSRFEARALVYDHRSQDLDLAGPVRGSIEPLRR